VRRPRLYEEKNKINKNKSLGKYILKLAIILLINYFNITRNIYTWLGEFRSREIKKMQTWILIKLLIIWVILVNSSQILCGHSSKFKFLYKRIYIIYSRLVAEKSC
jgi:hypothetical protein